MIIQTFNDPNVLDLLIEIFSQPHVQSLFCYHQHLHIEAYPPTKSASDKQAASELQSRLERLLSSLSDALLQKQPQLSEPENCTYARRHQWVVAAQTSAIVVLGVGIFLFEVGTAHSWVLDAPSSSFLLSFLVSLCIIGSALVLLFFLFKGSLRLPMVVYSSLLWLILISLGAGPLTLMYLNQNIPSKTVYEGTASIRVQEHVSKDSDGAETVTYYLSILDAQRFLPIEQAIAAPSSSLYDVKHISDPKILPLFKDNTIQISASKFQELQSHPQAYLRVREALPNWWILDYALPCRPQAPLRASIGAVYQGQFESLVANTAVSSKQDRQNAPTDQADPLSPCTLP